MKVDTSEMTRRIDGEDVVMFGTVRVPAHAYPQMKALAEAGILTGVTRAGAGICRHERHLSLCAECVVVAERINAERKARA